jgi:hypothetical protein
MELLNKLLTLLETIKRGAGNDPRPPTRHEWEALPEFIKQQIFFAAFDGLNGWDGEIYIAHWIR